MREHKNRPGGNFRAFFRSRKNIDASRRAEAEISLFENEASRSMGEPSEAFFPTHTSPTYFVIFPEGEIKATSPIKHELQKHFGKKD